MKLSDYTSSISYSTSILCGGQSIRMGRDKATLAWHGKPLVCHMIDNFRDCDDVFISVRDLQQLSKLDIRKAVDEVRGCGPIAGLAASLKAARHDILFVVTCDAPLVDEKTAELLVSELHDFDAVVPVSKDHTHPLIAVYRKSVINEVERSISQGNKKIMCILNRLHVNYYPAQNLPCGELTLSNLNTPDDVSALISLDKAKIEEAQENI